MTGFSSLHFHDAPAIPCGPHITGPSLVRVLQGVHPGVDTSAVHSLHQPIQKTAKQQTTKRRRSTFPLGSLWAQDGELQALASGASEVQVLVGQRPVPARPARAALRAAGASALRTALGSEAACLGPDEAEGHQAAEEDQQR